MADAQILSGHFSDGDGRQTGHKQTPDGKTRKTEERIKHDEGQKVREKKKREA
jgi:hypothetical protein